MATGLELIISSICNATICEVLYDKNVEDTLLLKKRAEIQNLTDELNGKHLKIGTYQNYPLSWVETENDTLVGHGVAFLIVDILQKKFNFTFEVVIPELNYVVGGRKPEDSLIGMVNNSLVDMAAAFLPQLVSLRKMVSYSHSLDEGVFLMMLKRPKESAAGSGLLAPFEEHVWYLILIAVVAYGPCIMLLTRLRVKLVNDDEKPISLSPSVWFVYGAFVKQGTTLSPEANTTRVLFATWWLFIILLSAFYTANLTAFLTLSKFTLDIENPKDLLKKNYRWISSQGGTVENMVKDPNDELAFLNVMIASGRAEFRPYINDQDFLPIVEAGAVLIKESTTIDHLMYGDYLKKAKRGVPEDKRCTFVIAPNAFAEVPRAFAFPIGSKLKDLFDPVLTYLLQAGIIMFLEQRDLPSTKICPLDLQSTDRQLRNSDLMMTYAIMLIGFAAAVATFIVEILLRRYVRTNQSKNNMKKRKKKASKKLRFKDTDRTQPPPYDSLFGRNSQYKSGQRSRSEVINGREYYVVDTVAGGTRLIPVRTPSAFLYQ